MSFLLNVIQAHDPTGKEMVRRVPEDGTADVTLGSVCVVEESQIAAFYRDGKIMDLLGPGRHVLSTLNLPVVSKVLGLAYGAKSPFTAAVYFVSQKVFTGMRWGTREPVAFRDKELGVVRLRAHGAFAMRVADPALFLNTVVGTQGIVNTADLADYLKDVIVSRLNDLLGERLTSLLDLPALYNELATETRLELKQDFLRLGIDLIDFFITSVVPTEEVQKALDEQAGIRAVGNLDAYLKFQAARALGRPGGNGEGPNPAVAGMGMGVGAGMGLILPQVLLGQNRVLPGAPCPRCGAAGDAGPPCVGCQKEMPVGSAFCPYCGLAQQKESSGLG